MEDAPLALKCPEATALQNALGSVADHDTWAMLIEIVSPHEAPEGPLRPLSSPRCVCRVFCARAAGLAKLIHRRPPCCYARSHTYPHEKPAICNPCTASWKAPADAMPEPATILQMLGAPDVSVHVVFGLGCPQGTP